MHQGIADSRNAEACEKDNQIKKLNLMIDELKLNLKDKKDKNEHLSHEEWFKEIEDATEGSEKDVEETEGFDAGFAFKTHVKGILTLVDKMMKTERIERETVNLMRRCKKHWMTLGIMRKRF